MKLLRQLDINTDTSSEEEAMPENNVGSVIANANGTPDSQIISPQSFNNYVPQDWSPQQQAAYQALNTPTQGSLNPMDYYPTLNHNINVGNYSGSEIGSTTLFAPAGTVLPLAMMDARDAAVHKQALQKLKEQEEFDKRYNSPSTKHVAVQQELSKNYQQGLQQWVNNAKQKYGQNWAQALQGDRNFQAWDKSHQDLAKYHDQIANHMAELDAAEKDPNFVLSPELRKQHAAMKSGIYSLGTGGINSQKTRNIENDFLASKGQYDLEKIANETVNKMKPEVTEEESGKVVKYVNGHAITSQKTTEGISDDRLWSRAEQIHGEKYLGTGVTVDAIFKALKNVAATKTTYKNQAIAPPPEKEGKGEDYSQSTPQTEAQLNQNVPEANTLYNTPGVHPIHIENVYNTTAKDQQKELTFTTNEKMVSLDGKPIQSESGYIKGQIQQVGDLPYYKNEKRFLTPKEAEGLKKVGGLYRNSGIEWRPGAVINVTPTTTNKGKISKSETVIAPLEDIKGKLGKSFDEHVINKVQQESANKNIEEQPKSSVSTYSIKGKDYSLSDLKKMGYTEEQVSAYKKK